MNTDGKDRPLREHLLVVDHNAYHLGALVTLRRALEAAAGGKGA